MQVHDGKDDRRVLVDSVQQPERKSIQETSADITVENRPRFREFDDAQQARRDFDGKRFADLPSTLTRSASDSNVCRSPVGRKYLDLRIFSASFYN